MSPHLNLPGSAPNGKKTLDDPLSSRRQVEGGGKLFDAQSLGSCESDPELFEHLMSNDDSSNSTRSDDDDEEEEEGGGQDLFLPPPPSWLEFDRKTEDKHRSEEDVAKEMVSGYGATMTKAIIFGDVSISDVNYFSDDNRSRASGITDDIITTDPTKQQEDQISTPHDKKQETKQQHPISIPKAAHEILQTAIQRSIHNLRILYSTRAIGKYYRRNSDLGSIGGFPPELLQLETSKLNHLIRNLPAFSCLKWNDRQLVHEWRSIFANREDGEEDEYFEKARQLIPRPISPPLWKNLMNCHRCTRLFNPSLLRHHCRLCGYSYCRACCPFQHKLPHLGYDMEVPEKVCGDCKGLLEDRDHAERIAWRTSRARDYFSGTLTPYFETGVDTVEDAALRIAHYTIQLTRQIPLGAQATVAVETVEVLRKHGLHGIYAMVLREEFMAAADLLRKVAGINEQSWPLSVHELSAAIFYALAQNRWVRGVDPGREEWMHTLMVVKEGTGRVERGVEKNEHENPILDETDAYDPLSESVTNLLAMADYAIQTTSQQQQPQLQLQPPPEQIQIQSEEDLFGPFISAIPPKTTTPPPKVAVCTHLPTPTLSSLLFYAPLALTFIYSQNPVDIQLLAAQQNWSLLYSNLEQNLDTDFCPASALFLHRDQKIACFAVRGTATVQDVVTDIRAMPVPFPDGHDDHNQNWHIVNTNFGLANSGMARAANFLFKEHREVLLTFARKGYRIRIVGHSLGGGVAALLGVLMRRCLEKEAGVNDVLRRALLGDYEDGRRRNSDSNDLLRVYAYGTPACMDGKLADYTASFVTSVVLHDDVVPRLTPTSIRKLMKHLLYIRETWVKAHLNQDVTAIASRVCKGWAPRWRGSFVLLGKKVEKKMKKYALKNNHNSDCGEKLDVVHEGSEEEEEGEDNTSTTGEAVDGDFFYDTEQNLMESDDESDDGMDYEKRTKNDETTPFDEPSSSPPQQQQTDSILLEETPLPRMFIPGKIAHIYTHNGGYKASYVPRSFRELRRISLAGNMLMDHMSKKYYEALLEVKSVRKAKSPLPDWVGFSSVEITEGCCACCASKFTWASTCDSEAQEARDKHNCRSCGSLVCEPCARNRIALPLLGIEVPVRVCDGCYHDMGRVLNGDEGEDMMRSYLGEEVGGGAEEQGVDPAVSVWDCRERDTEEKHSLKGGRKSLVNDLAHRIHTSSSGMLIDV